MLGLLVVLAVAQPAPQGAVWTCERAQVFGIRLGAQMEENQFLSMFSGSATGSVFTDPAGKASGSASWTTPELKIKEGDTIKLSMRATNMIVSFEAININKGLSFRRGVRHPWDPPADSLTFEFKFEPPPNVKVANMSYYARPGIPNAWDGSGTRTVWVFRKGDLPTAPKGGDVILSAFSYRFASDPVAVSTSAQPVKGVAADGVTHLLVRAASEQAGSATLTVQGGGGLFPLDDDPLKSAGSDTITVTSKPSGDGKHVAYALYRPPSAFGNIAGHQNLNFRARWKSGSKEIASKEDLTLQLVRPPVVLVHGTYDNPQYCYEEHDAQDEAPTNLGPRLREYGFKDIFFVDWEETNGSKDPSNFATNERTVYENKGGIKEALAAMRARGIAVTQADVVCHSQGGVITRVYAKGYPLASPMPAHHPHLTNPKNCQSDGLKCWYHRSENYWMGDIHRLITISSTHLGSHVCNFFVALEAYPSDRSATVKIVSDLFRMGVDKFVTGVTTGGFYNQVPGSLELRSLGATPVAAHAIACVASDEIMKTVRQISGVTSLAASGTGDYYQRLFKIWIGTPDDAKLFVFDWLGKQALEAGDPKPMENAKTFRELLAWKSRTSGMSEAELDRVIFHMRRTIFKDEPNDCTVSQSSSLGGLQPPYTTVVENVLHGWAPRYIGVQNRVIELLVNDGSLLDPNGFPNTYHGVKSQASGFFIPTAPAERFEPYVPSSLQPPKPPTNPASQGAAETKPTAAGAWSGNWNTGSSWGQEPLILTQNGNQVTGTFRGGKGSLTGTVTGLTLKFTFVDNYLQETGDGEVTLSADGQSMQGMFKMKSYGDLRLSFSAIRMSSFASNFRWPGRASLAFP